MGQEKLPSENTIPPSHTPLVLQDTLGMKRCVLVCGKLAGLGSRQLRLKCERARSSLPPLCPRSTRKW